MVDDGSGRGRVREPDPTLGARHPAPPAADGLSARPGGPSQPPPRPRRKRVVLAEPSRGGSLRARVELQQQTSWGELLIKDLIKVQLRSGILLAGLTVLILGSLPLLFHLVPGFARLRLIGLPVAWLLLGIAPFPLLFGVGLWYNRLAERHERDFVDMIEN
jgi:hypothetical protein